MSEWKPIHKVKILVCRHVRKDCIKNAAHKLMVTMKEMSLTGCSLVSRWLRVTHISPFSLQQQYQRITRDTLFLKSLLITVCAMGPAQKIQNLDLWYFKANPVIKSLAEVLGLPQGFFLVGHVWSIFPGRVLIWLIHSDWPHLDYYGHFPNMLLNVILRKQSVNKTLGNLKCSIWGSHSFLTWKHKTTLVLDSEVIILILHLQATPVQLEVSPYIGTHNL